MPRSGAPPQPSDPYYFDELAAPLARTDTDRGFQLLVTLLRQPYEKGAWDPLDEYQPGEFWKVLREADRERAVHTILAVALEEPSQRHRLLLGFGGAFEQEGGCRHPGPLCIGK
jgi:hypothetical protein